MEKALLLLVLAEAITENIKWLVNKDFNADKIIAFVTSIVICVLAGFDAFGLIGWELVLPYAGSVLTGIAVSRGAGILHDLIKAGGGLFSKVGK